MAVLVGAWRTKSSTNVSIMELLASRSGLMTARFAHKIFALRLSVVSHATSAPVFAEAMESHLRACAPFVWLVTCLLSQSSQPRATMGASVEAIETAEFDPSLTVATSSKMFFGRDGSRSANDGPIRARLTARMRAAAASSSLQCPDEPPCWIWRLSNEALRCRRAMGAR